MHRLKIWVRRLTALTLLALFQASAASAADADAIRSEMMKTWDKPDARLVVEPVVVAGDHAIAGWSQGDMGGRALLRRKPAGWDVILCAGDDLKKPDVLAKVGLQDAVAKALSADLAKAEAKLDPARLTLFSKFEGLVMVGGDGGQHHPAQHRPSHQPHGQRH